MFPNSRVAVEFYSDRLRRRCEDERVPNEFWPHHGNLSKDIREETEAALKQKERPASAICTSTLELGIDIGSVTSIVQIGPPPSVASLRQRLGRSGRRKGEPAILRCFAIERQLTAKSGLSDQLREGMVQTVAMIRLLVVGWYEPLSMEGLHASTLVQQLLSIMAQHGGLQADQAWALLCENGPFAGVSKRHFLSLLRRLGEEEVIFQDVTGLLLLAPNGERITQHYSFYAAFSTDEEYRIVTSGRTLGSMPVNRPLVPGSFLIFAGRRWRVLSVSQEELVIDVTAAAGGTASQDSRVAWPPFSTTACERKCVKSCEQLPLFLSRRIRPQAAPGGKKSTHASCWTVSGYVRSATRLRSFSGRATEFMTLSSSSW